MNQNEMKQLIESIMKYARPLEVARLNYLFFEGSKDAIIDELAKYQNEDGGFGHALEPDIWNPNSSPIQTWVAITILRTLDLKRDHPMIIKILNYLESSFDGFFMTWLRLDESNDNYPHAPWWSYQDEIPSFNPSASIAGFVIRYAPPLSEVYKQAFYVADYVVKSLKYTDDILEVHELRSVLDMANDLLKSHHAGLINHDIKKNLIHQMESLLEKDPNKWFTSYCVKPSALIKAHPSIGSDVFKDLMLEEFELALKSRDKNGVWPITWQWTDYPEAFEIAFKNWIGVLGCEYLELMLNYEYIKK